MKPLNSICGLIKDGSTEDKILNYDFKIQTSNYLNKKITLENYVFQEVIFLLL